MRDEMKVVGEFKDGYFKSIIKYNYDGSIHLEDYCLYKNDSIQESRYIVTSSNNIGSIIYEGTLDECLEFMTTH